MPATPKAKVRDRYTAISSALKYLNDPDYGPRPSVRKTAERFGLAESTQRYAIMQGSPKRPGPATVLTEEEESEDVGYCLKMQQLGFGLTKESVNGKAFLKGSPSRAWWDRFMRDHPELSFRVPQALTAHAQRGNQTIVSDHFDKLGEIIQQYSLTLDRLFDSRPYLEYGRNWLQRV